MPEIEPEVRAYYERGNEADRLKGGFPSGPLEFVRTQEILLRYLPPPPLQVLDVGGGPGVYAGWLAERGDKVLVIDPIPLHSDQARAAHARVSAEIGDARHLLQKDSSYDVVLLMGPLYHLVERDERLLALREAKRVLRPGRLLFATAISRFAALMDLLVRLDRVHEPEILPIVEKSVATGIFHGSVGGLFTTAYFHLPRDFVREVEEAGFVDVKLLNVEGPGVLVADFEARWRDPARREAMLRAARLAEEEPEMMAASSHLLAVGVAPN